jgi:hypothetical protein
MGGKGEMTKAPISLQDLRRSLYRKAKAEPACRFWGLYVHVCKRETLHQAYQMAKKNNGAPGIDGVTFAAIEESGVESFLQQIQAGNQAFSERLRFLTTRHAYTKEFALKHPEDAKLTPELGRKV